MVTRANPQASVESSAKVWAAWSLTSRFPLLIAVVTQIESGGTLTLGLQLSLKYSMPTRSREGWRCSGSLTITLSPPGHTARLSPEDQRTLGPWLAGPPPPSMQNGQSPRTGDRLARASSPTRRTPTNWGGGQRARAHGASSLLRPTGRGWGWLGPH